MKKLLSILLALVMVFSLTAPAFADGLSTEDAIGIIGGADGPTAVITTGPGPDDPYIDWVYEPEQDINDFITSHGGVPGQINVMVNGRYVQSPDAVPELSGGRTMVPFRAIFEALGAEVSFDSGKVRAQLGDTVLELTIGSNTLTKTDAGSSDTVQMDCAPYLKNNRTYVPVRFISEALGYDVQWDDYYQSAVITNLNALAEQIDQGFTVYNKLAARSAFTGQTQKAVGSGKADVTLFDPQFGDKTGNATYSYDLTASADGASGKIEYDFATLWALLEGYIPVPLDMDASQNYAETLARVKSLMQGSIEIRMNLNKGVAYLSMPALIEIMSSYMEQSGIQLPKNAWVSASLGSGTDLGRMTALLSQSVSVGKLLVSIAGESFSGDFSAEIYDNILTTAEQFGALFGDTRFTRQGDTAVLTITKENLVGLDGYTGEDLETLNKFDYTMTVHDNGDVDVSYQARVSLAGSEVKAGDTLDISVTGSTRDGKSESSMDLQIENVMKASVTIQETLTQTDEAPAIAPPQDVLVVPIDGNIPGGGGF